MVEFSLLFRHILYIWGLFIAEGSVWGGANVVKGCQLAGQDTVWKLGRRATVLALDHFPTSCVDFLPMRAGRECRVGRHDISAVQTQPGSSNGLPAKSGGTWISLTAAKQWPRNLIRRERFALMSGRALRNLILPAASVESCKPTIKD